MPAAPGRAIHPRCKSEASLFIPGQNLRVFDSEEMESKQCSRRCALRPAHNRAVAHPASAPDAVAGTLPRNAAPPPGILRNERAIDSQERTRVIAAFQLPS